MLQILVLGSMLVFEGLGNEGLHKYIITNVCVWMCCWGTVTANKHGTLSTTHTHIHAHTVGSLSDWFQVCVSVVVVCDHSLTPL